MPTAKCTTWKEEAGLTVIIFSAHNDSTGSTVGGGGWVCIMQKWERGERGHCILKFTQESGRWRQRMSHGGEDSRGTEKLRLRT